jgi:hypothetical protein
VTAIVSYLIAFDVVVVAAVLFYLIVQTRELLVFSRDVKALPPTGFGSDPAPFSGKGELPKLGNQFINAFRTADANNAISQFDVEKQLTPTALRLRSMGQSTRSVAGLLILVALVITLLNLQGAVSSLGVAFRRLPDPAKPETQTSTEVVSSVQNAMGGVADTASSAFLASGATIGSALILLVCALGLQRQAAQDMRRLIGWGHSAYAARLADSAKRTPAEQRVEFSDAIKSFSALVDSFGTLSTELATLGEFRTELATAVVAISTAVDKLPATIQANISSLSSQVTREIAEDLKRQYEILSRLLAAYGDLGLNVKTIEKFTTEVIKQHTDASQALVSLAGLPAHMQRLTSSSDALSNAVTDLKTKTDQMPAFDFKPTETTLAEVEASLNGIQTSLVQFRERTQLKQDGLEATLGVLMASIKEVGKSHDDLKQSAISPITAQLGEIQRRLDAVDANVINTDYGQLIAGIRQQLTEIQNRGFIKNVFGGR